MDFEDDFRKAMIIQAMACEVDYMKNSLTTMACENGLQESHSVTPMTGEGDYLKAVALQPIACKDDFKKSKGLQSMTCEDVFTGK